MNSISGLFPNAIQNMSSLAFLDISDNNILGSVPLWLGEFMFLTHLNLARNELSAFLGRLSSLRGLSLYRNHLKGHIPDSLGKLLNLEILDLSTNSFEGALGEILLGTIPQSLYRSDSLESLNLSNNSLHGELPSTLQSCHFLNILDLGNNGLYGNIPSSMWVDFSEIRILRLRQNKFNGNIPSSLCQLPYLQILDLANNNFTGIIPFCIGNLRGMMINKQALDYQSEVDEASEPLVPASSPMYLPDFDQWQKVHVKQFMKGREFDYIRTLQYVINMDLSSNNLVGFIPEVITSLNGLVNLNLSHNSLSGEIPSKIGKMKFLESLDLSWNQLEGALPSSMSSLTFLTRLNLSYNNFSGPIPEENQFLALEDPSIYIGNQYLCGEPVLKKCSRDDNNEAPIYEGKDDDNKKEKILFYFVVTLGFMTGFWGAIGVLVVNKRLRYVCFRYVEKIADQIYVAIAIRVARIKRIWQKS
ncbi:receptor-like protein EIX2 [Prosopis cineraria]|uniref:receptor-like protein EIX2 n=1 Tax=Prosopis cineraria TaxID=364024 RepID=UPI0024108565|nr:receptor-like protein EIX2 [Prosopis cineraria]